MKLYLTIGGTRTLIELVAQPAVEFLYKLRLPLRSPTGWEYPTVSLQRMQIVIFHNRQPKCAINVYQFN